MESRTANKYPDGLDVLVCKISIWEPSDKNTIDIVPPDGKCLIIRECEDIQIEDTYKKLITTATVKFPQGTIIKRTITANDLEEDGTTTVYTERLNDGAIIEQRSGTSIATPSDFAIGQRIRIQLGYYRDDGTVFKSESDRIVAMDKVVEDNINFDGYITKCSVSTPIEIKCENLASNLKRKNCRKIPAVRNTTVNDFLETGGKYDLLKGTGLKLHPNTAQCKINIGMVQLTNDLTVADVLTEWSKYGLYAFLRTDDNGNPCVQVGRTYFSSKTAESIINNDGESLGKLIQFNYHVANDGLTLMNTDPKYLAVSAEGFKYEKKKEVKYSITIRLNPEWTGKSDTTHKKFQLLNETKLSRKSQKLGAVQKSETKDKVDLSQYTVIPYTARKIGITEDELIKEAEAYFENYTMNGIEGSVTIFGDYNIQSGTKVELLDTRQPEKNGWYLVEEVTTNFGINGFRQTLKLPYCIAKPTKTE